MGKIKIRRYVVTVRHPNTDGPYVASRHLTHRAATRRASWLRLTSGYRSADVRASHADDAQL